MLRSGLGQNARTTGGAGILPAANLPLRPAPSFSRESVFPNTQPSAWI
jgi:hypothetical protein